MEKSSSSNTPYMDWSSNDLPSAWKSFRRHVEFMFGGPLESKSEEQKCNYLMIWIGEKGRDIHQTWNLSTTDGKKLSVYYDKFESYCRPKSNKIFARYKFHKKQQEESESFQQFVTELKLLVKDCGYGQPDEMVRDRIVIGCHSTKVRERLIEEGSDLSLDKAIEIGQTMELSKTQLKTFKEEDPKVQAVRVKQSRYTPPSKKICENCGYELPHKSKENQCPAKGKQCKKCLKYNHFAKVCKSSNKKVNTVEEDDSDSDSDSLYVSTIHAIKTGSSRDWMTKIEVNGNVVEAQLDTGAKCNVMAFSTYQSLDVNTPIRKNTKKLTSYSGHDIPIVGVTTIQCQVNNRTYAIEFYVTEIDASTILGAQTCTQLQLLQRVDEISTKSTEHSDILDEFPDVFKGLGCLPGKHTIRIDSTVTPVIHPPRKVPFAYKDKVKEELERMEKEGVVIRQTDPTPWVNSMVTVIKPNKVRICIDPRDLNLAIQREHFPMKTIEEIIAEMPNAKVFTVLDATSGFWQVELDEESSKLCTFNTPFGRYRFTRLPFGIKSAPEVFQRYMSEMLEGIPGAQPISGADAIVDDILVWGTTVKEHDERLRKVLERAQAYNLKLNKTKCQLRKDEVTYVGHVISKDGLKPDPEKVRAVVEMKPPQNLKELRTFLGFIQYLGKFLPNLATESAPLRQLLEKDVEWHWDESQSQCFQKLKELVTTTPVLSFYDPTKEVLLSVDASSTGLGAVLIQDEKPIAYASRALTAAQQKYAQIEKELLAIVYGCNKFHQYVYGRTVRVESDHKPLEAIMQKSLNQAPLRLQRMLLSLQKYDLRVKYKPGQTMQLADTLSRNYLPETNEVLVQDLEVCEIAISMHLPVSKPKYEEFQKATAEDPIMQQLIDTVLEGWPAEKSQLPTDLRVYWTFRDEIAVLDGLLFKGPKLIVPHSLRKEMLEKIHEGHLGMVKCKQRGRDILYWPGLARDIDDKVSKCQVCVGNQRQQPKEPLMPHEPPSRPWAKIGTDLYVLNNQHYLCTVDYYSKWIEMDKLSDETSKTTIDVLKGHFARYGIPDEVISDNGPQFASKEFANFAKDYDFNHTTTSPLYPQSNGQVERAVQIVKNLMSKSHDINKALLSYRSTPLDVVNQSPSQLLMGRRIKTTLPTTAELLKPSHDSVKDKLAERANIQKKYFDKHASKELPVLQKGDIVRMKHGKEWIPATVAYKHESPRSYVIQTPDGRKYRRNRRQLNRRRVEIEIPKDVSMYQPKVSNYTPPLQVAQPSHKESSAENQQQKESESEIPESTPTTTTRSGRTVKKPSYLQDYV